MISVITFILALGMVSSFNLSDVGLPGRELKNEGRIYNGINAVPGQFPYQVKIEVYLTRDVIVCGGALIHPEWVLTAAHCLVKFESMVVILGETAGSDCVISFDIRKEKVTRHDDYNEENITNDIGLIRIPEVELSNNINIVQLPAMASSYNNYFAQPVIFSGFGFEFDKALNLPETLKWGRMKVISNAQCQNVFKQFITDSHICAASILHVSPCMGDSGGPLSLASDNTLIGISSYIDSVTCEGGYPGVFTRITSYLGWIETKTGIAY